MKTTKCFLLTLFVFANSLLYADINAAKFQKLKANYDKKGKYIMVVGRVETSGINPEEKFAANYAYQMPFNPYIYRGTNDCYDNRYSPVEYNFGYDINKVNFNSNDVYSYNFALLYTAPDGEYFIGFVPKSRVGKVDIDNINVFVYPKLNGFSLVTIDLNLSIPVAKGCEILYLGTFKIDFDYAMRINKFEYIDEYDQAKDWLVANLGEDVELTRAELEVREEDVKKRFRK